MTVGEVAELMARIEDDKANVVQPKAAAVCGRRGRRAGSGRDPILEGWILRCGFIEI